MGKNIFDPLISFWSLLLSAMKNYYYHNPHNHHGQPDQEIGRKFFVNPNSPIGPYLGDFKIGDEFLAKKEGWTWIFPKYLNALFRGVGQVIFCNNPISGFIILVCLYWADFNVGLATQLAASVAILTAFIFQQDVKKIDAGLTTYNAVLVGSVTSSLWTPFYNEPLTLKIWAFIIIAAFLSVPVNTAIGNLFGSFKQPLPSFTFAFNIVTILLFKGLQPMPSSSTTRSLDVNIVNDLEVPSKEGLLWSGVVRGILLSMGQVYAIQNLEGSILMYFSALFYSPTVFMMSFVGATVGTTFGICFADAPNYDPIYDGLWGYNGILAAIAVGGFFFALTWLSFLTAVADVLLAVFIQQALTIAFGPLKLPALTYPFVLSSILFLEMNATGNLLWRVTKLSVPENHKYDYLKMLDEKKKEPSMMNRKTSGITKAGNAENREYYKIKPTAPPYAPVYPDLESGLGHFDFEQTKKQQQFYQNYSGSSTIPDHLNQSSYGHPFPDSSLEIQNRYQRSLPSSTYYYQPNPIQLRNNDEWENYNLMHQHMAYRR